MRLIFVLLLCLFLSSPSYAEIAEYIMVNREVGVKLEPKDESEELTKAQVGDIFIFDEDFGDWFSVFIFSGEPRYIKKTSAKFINEFPKKQLSEGLRKKVFFELVQMEDKATKEAETKYPDNLDKQIDYERALADRYKLGVCHRYGINTPQGRAIQLEGVVNNWPKPSW